MGGLFNLLLVPFALALSWNPVMRVIWDMRSYTKDGE